MNVTNTIYRASLKDMDAIANSIVQLHPLVITLTGEIGAGKTTLTQHILRHFGITDPVASPTYAYVTLYTTPQGVSLYHFDLYRLTSLSDFRNAGFEEYLYQPNSLSIIEWPAFILPLLAHDVCHVKIEYYGSDERTVTLEYTK